MYFLYLFVSFKPEKKIQKDTKRYMYLLKSFERYMYLLKKFERYMYLLKKIKDTCIFLYLFVSFETGLKDTKRYIKIH